MNQAHEPISDWSAPELVPQNYTEHIPISTICQGEKSVREFARTLGLVNCVLSKVGKNKQGSEPRWNLRLECLKRKFLDIKALHEKFPNLKPDLTNSSAANYFLATVLETYSDADGISEQELEVGLLLAQYSAWASMQKKLNKAESRRVVLENRVLELEDQLEKESARNDALQTELFLHEILESYT